MNYTIRYNTETGPQDVYLVMADGQEVLVAADVTETGIEWVADQMALVDDHDKAQVEMVAADIRKRMPVRFLWYWQQAEIRRLDNMPLRRANGTFRTQGAA